MQSNYMEWMEKTLQAEQAEWSGDRPPDEEPHSGAYHTHAPVIIFQMIDQNLQVYLALSIYPNMSEVWYPVRSPTINF